MQHQAGDIWLHYGRNWPSLAIALGSPCYPSQWLRGVTPSHAAVVADHEGVAKLFEFTTLATEPCEIQGKRIAGGQCHSLDRKLATYRGKIWRLPVAEPLTAEQSDRLSKFCLSHVGMPYDDLGLWETGALFLRYATFWRPSQKSFICSRFVMLALRDAGVVGRDVVPAEFTPARLERDLVREELYLPAERLK